jgi:UrcA family protein
MYESFKLPIVAAGLAAALIGFAAPAMAEPSYFNAAVSVHYHDVDLTSQKGRETLDRRVNAAISGMCGQPVFGTREEAEALRNCRIEARTTVEPQLQSVFANANTKVAAR